MLEQTKLLGRARAHQPETGKIFKVIAKKENAMLPDGGMLRNVMLIISKGKSLFSTDQLVKVCEHTFEKLLFVVFKAPADSRPYVVIVFLHNSQYEAVVKLKQEWRF